MAGPGWFQEIVGIANGVLTIAACVLVVGLLVAGMLAWRALRLSRMRLAAARRDLAPLLATARRVADNLDAASATIRADIDAIHGTVTEANTGARAAVRAADRRLRRLSGVVGAVEEEIEAALVDVVAAARGVRAGASALRGLMGVGDRDGHPAASARPRPSRADASRGGERDGADGIGTETYDSGDSGDADDTGRDAGNGRARPRIRSRRR